MVGNMVKVGELQVKELFAKSKLPDADYICNPYVGCPPILSTDSPS